MINSITFNITNSCQLNCRYCFEHSKNGLFLSLDDMKTTLDYLYERSDKSSVFYVAFFGGEPLLRWNDIKALISYANEKNYLIEWSFTTNFVYQFTDDDMTFIEDNNVYILVSIDGDKDTHDLNRCNSYNSVVSNIERFKKYDLMNRLEGRITFTPETVDKLSHNVEHLFNLGFIELGFYPVSDVYWEEEKLKVLVDQVSIISDWLIDKYNDINNTQNIDIRNINENISLFPEMFEKNNVEENIKTFKCSLQSIHQVTINPDKTVHACHQESTTDANEFLLGTIDDLLNGKISLNDISSKLNLSFLESERVLDDRFGLNCKTCLARKACPGCCPAESFRQTRSFNNVPAVCCFLAIALAINKIKILDKLLNAKNVRGKISVKVQCSLKLYQSYLNVIKTSSTNPSAIVEASKLLEYIKDNSRLILEDYIRVINEGLSYLLGK